MWTIFYDCIIKVQKYTYSCFPCSLHMGLANLGYVEIPYQGEDDSVENVFNKICEMENKEDLNAAGPTSVLQLIDITAKYLKSSNITLSFSEIFYTLEKNTTILDNLNKWNEKRSYAAIVGTYSFGGHATLIIKNEDRFIHIYTGREIDGIYKYSTIGENITMKISHSYEDVSLIEFWELNKINESKKLICSGNTVFIFK